MTSMFFSTLTEIHSEPAEMERLHAIDKAVDVTHLALSSCPEPKAPKADTYRGLVDSGVLALEFEQ